MPSGSYSFPTASFVSSFVGYPLPHQGSFTGSNLAFPPASVVSYKWNWGNGRTETKTVPSTKNTWGTSGSFNVALTITDSYGASASVTQSVSVP